MTGTVLVDTNVFTAARGRGEPRADLWIAATAIRWSIPLVAHDAVFAGCPGVQLVTELGG